MLSPCKLFICKLFALQVYQLSAISSDVLRREVGPTATVHPKIKVDVLNDPHNNVVADIPNLSLLRQGSIDSFGAVDAEPEREHDFNEAVFTKTLKSLESEEERAAKKATAKALQEQQVASDAEAKVLAIKNLLSESSIAKDDAAIKKANAQRMGQEKQDQGGNAQKAWAAVLHMKAVDNQLHAARGKRSMEPVKKKVVAEVALGLLALAFVLLMGMLWLSRDGDEEASSLSGQPARSTSTSSSSSQSGPHASLRASHEVLRQKVHNLPVSELQDGLGTVVQDCRLGALVENAGLSPESEGRYREAFGPNRMTPPEKENVWLLLLKQIFGGLFNIMLWICVVAQIVVSVMSDGEDLATPIFLSIVIIGSGTLQWWTELQAMQMMDALQKMQVVEDVSVFRNGQEHAIPADSLLPGDVVILEAGHRVPADVRVIDCTGGALVDNSALTGETMPEARTSGIASDATLLMEATNILFSGTSIVQGKLLCVVYATGDHTVLGQIASKVNMARPRSSLEIQIEHFVHLIAFIAIAVGALSLVANFSATKERSASKILENSATAFFAQVPEGLLPTVTACLMIASRKMAKRNVLIRKIDAVETLGCMSVLCSDKTGTLTSGHMTATELVIPRSSGLAVLAVADTKTEGDAEVTRLAQCGVLNSSVKMKSEDEFLGSPTEVAIATACHKALGAAVASEVKDANPVVFEIPFNSANKWMLTVHSANGFRAILKGAPERVMGFCNVSSSLTSEFEKTQEDLMGQGKRVLAVAEKRIEGLAKDFDFKGTGPKDTNFAMDSFELCGLVAIEDPPKEGVAEAIDMIRHAGGVTIMVTGDHPSTARAIASRIGILERNGDSDPELARNDTAIAEEYQVMTGAILAQHMPPDECEFESLEGETIEFWRNCVEHTRVFARVSPMHKRLIVRAYQHIGNNIVGMTGDGVNDAPALKEAEIGIAMGIRGTEVAKEAADIVLLDDNLQSVVKGIEQGRVCSENLRKSIRYTLCSKIPQVLPSLLEPFGVPQALTAGQVLLIDVGTDIWTAIAYAFQPPEGDLMQNKPRHPKTDRMVNKQVLAYAYCWIGMLQSIFCWITFFAMPEMMRLFIEQKEEHHYKGSEVQANQAGRTMYYWTLVLGQVGAGLACTTSRESLLQYGFPNRILTLCIILEIGLAALTIFCEPLAKSLRMQPLTPTQMAFGLSGFYTIMKVEETRKFFLRRMHVSRPPGQNLPNPQ